MSNCAKNDLFFDLSSSNNKNKNTVITVFIFKKKIDSVYLFIVPLVNILKMMAGS